MSAQYCYHCQSRMARAPQWDKRDERGARLQAFRCPEFCAGFDGVRFIFTAATLKRLPRYTNH